MAPLLLRVRHKGRSLTLAGVPEDIKVSELREMISADTGVPVDQQILKVGVPPVTLQASMETSTLAEAGFKNRDTVLLDEDGEPPLVVPLPRSSTGGDRISSSSVRDDSLEPSRKRGREEDDVREADLLPAFDRAIGAAYRHAKECPEDKHQIWALKKGKAAVQESLRAGNNISISALHTLTGVGHWVVQTVREHMSPGAAGSGGGGRPTPAAKRRAAPPPTPASFTWWYLNKKGKAVRYRNDADCHSSSGTPQFRVCISHASGRLEKAFLPDAKAPPACPPGGPDGKLQ